jgi:LysR family transcriptional activator of nhaA
VVLSDAPIGTTAQIQGFNHLLIESGVSFFANPDLAKQLRRGFPKSLNGAAMLLPTDHTQVRRSLNAWFDSKRIHPIVVGEFDDSALMFWFGQTGTGVFPAPSILEKKIQESMGVRLVGRAGDVRERFYAISLEATVKHPAVVAVCDAARKALSDR